MDIDNTLAELTAQHETLTAAYQGAKQNGTRAQYAQAKADIAAFRAKYFKVIKALDEVAATGTTEV